MQRPNARSARLELAEDAIRSGVTTLDTIELLALVLGPRRGSPRADAARLLDAAGGLSGIVRFSSPHSATELGVGRAAATRLAAALELGRRALVEQTRVVREVVSSFEAVERWARPRLAALDHEEVWLLCLDGRNGLRSARRIAQGGAHGCALTPRDVLAPAVREGASGIVLVHNHPSGDPTPSPEDLAMTEAVARASQVVGIPLLDHVVVSRSGAASVADAIGER